jgi:hypothetical protein
MIILGLDPATANASNRLSVLVGAASGGLLLSKNIKRPSSRPSWAAPCC